MTRSHSFMLYTSSWYENLPLPAYSSTVMPANWYGSARPSTFGQPVEPAEDDAIAVDHVPVERVVPARVHERRHARHDPLPDRLPAAERAHLVLDVHAVVGEQVGVRIPLLGVVQLAVVAERGLDLFARVVPSAEDTRAHAIGGTGCGGGGPTYCALGRMSRLSAACSRMCAHQPITRLARERRREQLARDAAPVHHDARVELDVRVEPAAGLQLVEHPAPRWPRCGGRAPSCRRRAESATSRNISERGSSVL